MDQAMLRDQCMREADEVFLEHPLPAVCLDDFGVLFCAVKKARYQGSRVTHCNGLLLYAFDKPCPIRAASGRG
jgi:hypothetical protein